MADISRIARLIGQMPRNFDLAANTLVMQSLKVTNDGGATSSELTKAILDNLIAVQGGGDISDTYHNHDGIYTRTTALANSGVGTSGAAGVGYDDSVSSLGATNLQTAVAALKVLVDNVTGDSDFGDDVFRVSDNADATKKIAFEASNIASGNVRTITMADANVDLADIATNTSNISTNTSNIALKANQADVVLRDGSQAFTADQSMGGNKITNAANPTADQDVATKAYVDSVSAGLDPKQSVRAFIDSNVDVTTGGLGTYDGVVLAEGDRVVLNGQTDPTENGIRIASSGAWARSTDHDGTPANEVSGGNFTFVEQGTQYGGTGWVLQGDGNLTIDTDNIVWVQFSTQGQILAGDGINKVGNTISVDVSNIAGAGLEDDGANNLRLAASVAGTGIALAAGVLSIDFSEFDTDSITEGATNKFYASSLFDTDFAGKSTSDLSEGTNLYYTQARFDAAFAAKNAGDLNYAQANTSDWTVADNSSIKATMDEVGSRLTALEGAPAEALQRTKIAGEAFTAGLYAVRWGKTGQGETAGRLYKADKDASSQDNFYVDGIAIVTGSVSAGQSISFIKMGLLNSATHGFTVGEPIYLGSAGALTNTPPVDGVDFDDAVVYLGKAEDADNIDVRIQERYVV